MENYIEMILLGLLVILVYKKYLQNVHNNKIMLGGLLLLNAYLM